ncbi:MAG: PqiB family protein [Caulobacteraceae bacterium]
MSDTDPIAAPGGGDRVRTLALVQRGRWPGLVWALPLAALLIVSYLGLNAYAKRGVDIVVTFGTSGGARAGDTPVIYKGVIIGKVEKIQISRDIHHVDMTLRLDPRTRSALREGAQFWLIGAQASLTDLSALKAVVSGVSIGAAPGTGAPTRHFVGLDRPPPVPPDTAGRFFRLQSASVGPAPVGAGVYFHGVEVGWVTAADIHGAHDFSLGVFVSAPYDRLVHQDTVFFATHAVEVGLSNAGLTADIGPGTSALTHGVEFDNPGEVGDAPEASAGASFPLLNTEADAQAQPTGPQIAYAAVFRGAAMAPAPNAPVTLEGMRIGRVLSSQLGLVVGDTAPATRVQLEIEPDRLNLTGALAGGDGRRAADAALAGLIRGGYRLKLGQAPPLVGPQALVLTRVAAAAPALIHYSQGAPDLPTAPSSDLAGITDQASAILQKVNQIPLTQIGSDVRALTARMRQLAASPQLTDGLNHLDSTLSQVDAMVREVRPQMGPLVTKLDAAAGQLQAVASSADAVLSGRSGPQDANLPDAIHQLTEAARSIRSLADYLGRHPEAVIRGKPKEP